MPKKYCLPLLYSLLLCPFFSFSQSLDFNGNCRAAYHEIISLRPDSGKALLAEEKRQHPGNFIPLLLENYSDFLTIIITEDERMLSSFRANKNKRLSMLRDGDAASPWFRFAQAEIHLHYALSAILFREYVSGLMELKKAYLLLEENAERFPDFKPGKKSYFVIEALLGVIPEKYSWGLKLLGMSGNLEAGMRGLKLLTAQDWGDDAFLKQEAVMTYALLQLHLEGNRKEAWNAISGNFSEGNLTGYYTALKIAVYSHHNAEALALLPQRLQGNEYSIIPILDYYAGLAKLQNLDTTAAADFRRFITETKGKNFIKSAFHKIAWVRLISDDMEGYRMNMNLAKQSGTAQADADRQAQKEADDALPPHPDLLKARLLFDGGYYEKALHLLNHLSESSLAENRYRLELAYRQGRIFDETGDTVRAIERYMVTLSKGKGESYYFAANAALNLGLIYEHKGNYALAREYFLECLKLDNHEYRASLNQKAKAGLERVEKH